MLLYQFLLADLWLDVLGTTGNFPALHEVFLYLSQTFLKIQCSNFLLLTAKSNFFATTKKARGFSMPIWRLLFMVCYKYYWCCCLYIQLLYMELSCHHGLEFSRLKCLHYLCISVDPVLAIITFLKHTIFWDVVPCLIGTANTVPSSLIVSTLKMEVTCSFETSVLTKPTWYHIPEDGILHSHCCEPQIFHNPTWFMESPHQRSSVLVPWHSIIMIDVKFSR
jgi:hypothetical protein